MATWEDIQRDFSQRADEMNTTMDRLCEMYKADLAEAIKQARESDLWTALNKINSRLAAIEEKLEEGDKDKEDDSVGTTSSSPRVK